jgi:hypothetical protein
MQLFYVCSLDGKPLMISIWIENAGGSKSGEVASIGKPRAPPMKDNMLKFHHRELMVHEVAKNLLRTTPNDTLTLDQRNNGEETGDRSECEEIES